MFGIGVFTLIPQKKQASKDAQINLLQHEIDSLTIIQRQLPAELQKVFTNNLNFELGKLQGKIEERQEKLKSLTDTTAAK